MILNLRIESVAVDCSFLVTHSLITPTGLGKANQENVANRRPKHI